MKKKIIIILQILSVILYILMIGKKFPIFPQAMSLYELNLPLLELLKKGHILHFPRYMVVYPSIFLGNLLSIDIHIVNTVYSIILLMVIIYLWWNILECYNIRINLFSYLIMTSFLLLLLTYVNGRIIFGYFSEFLLVNYLSRYRFKINFITLLVLFFSTVSSGVMSVIIITCFCFWHLDKTTKKLPKKIIKKIFFDVPIFILVVYYFIIFMQKNLVYYSNNIFLMLSHGIFRDFFDIPIYLLLLFMLICLMIFVMIFIFFKKINRRLSIFFVSGGIGLAFGLTAGSLLLPIVIIYFLIIFNSVRKNLNKKQTNMKTYLKEEICN
jgi:membrane protein